MTGRLSMKDASFAVIFESTRSTEDEIGYAKMAAHMVELAQKQDGFCGIESYRNGQKGVTISWWRDRKSIAAWGRHPAHLQAQQRGRDLWYDSFRLEIVRSDDVRTFRRKTAP